MADQRAQEAMAEHTVREATADQGARGAMAEHTVWEAMADQGARGAMAEQTVREAMAGQTVREDMAEYTVREAMVEQGAIGEQGAWPGTVLEARALEGALEALALEAAGTRGRSGGAGSGGSGTGGHSGGSGTGRRSGGAGSGQRSGGSGTLKIKSLLYSTGYSKTVPLNICHIARSRAQTAITPLHGHDTRAHHDKSARSKEQAISPEPKPHKKSYQVCEPTTPCIAINELYKNMEVDILLNLSSPLVLPSIKYLMSSLSLQVLPSTMSPVSSLPLVRPSTLPVLSTLDLPVTSSALSISPLWLTDLSAPPWLLPPSAPTGTIVLTAPLGSLFPLAPPWSDVAPWTSGPPFL
ncbi:Protein REPRESSOR OF SILENCING 3 [Labeo rohita]|uniref:Protein REPRESSOR OF SILENCING 3 n=1 Tax=Labeo rohita TaxID=84645 RepID=A0ABQ8LY23_LABRO|nr:Protein REPRESSOR OF SILENCING 3 [Labeo rohita]